MPQISSKKKNILLVDDDVGDCRLVQLVLAKPSQPVDFAVETAGTLTQGLQLLKHGGVDLVLLDLSLPDSRGIETVRKTHEANPNVPIVVLTGLSDEEVGLEAIRSGAEDYCFVTVKDLGTGTSV